MKTHQPHDRKALAARIALAVALIGSLALIVWQRLSADRIDDLIDKARNALAAGNFEAFEGYRESASSLLQSSQAQYPWIYAGYIGLGIVFVAVWLRLIAKVRAR